MRFLILLLLLMSSSICSADHVRFSNSIENRIVFEDWVVYDQGNGDCRASTEFLIGRTIASFVILTDSESSGSYHRVYGDYLLSEKVSLNNNVLDAEGMTNEQLEQMTVGSELKITATVASDYRAEMGPEATAMISLQGSSEALNFCSALDPENTTSNYSSVYLGDCFDPLPDFVDCQVRAGQGNADAQYNLGVVYYEGNGVTQDYEQAVKWYRLAAEQGYADAQYNLGVMYTKGRGVPQDNKEAVKWTRLAAEQEHVDAQNNLGVMYEYYLSLAEDHKEAFKWYRLSAEQGFVRAQYNLAGIYKYGHGVVQNYKEAVKWYRLAAEQGYAQAQYDLGVMYTNGQGVVRDYKEAIKWYRLAAEQGDTSAQYNLGVMYRKGKGAAQDYKEAVKWTRLAAEQGNAKAQYKLGVIYNNKGQGVLQDHKEAAKWYRLAAEQGNAKAQYSLGGVYRIGKGVDRNDVMAHMYWSIAAVNGHQKAANIRGVVEEDMTPSQIAEAQKLAREWIKKHP